MSVKSTVLRLSALAVALSASGLVQAGGPLYIQDPDNHIPYAYPNGQAVRVYTDMGNLGVLSNATATAQVAYAFGQWTNVATSDFTAAVAGDFASRGLPDITGANADLLLGVENGGGVYVMYDHDGSIIRDFFGAPDGVLGIASPEWAEGTTITESWAVINGSVIAANDTTGSQFVGVMTHEFGHSINLGHSQTNGAILFFGDDKGPKDCALPYGTTITLNDIETMYPYISPAQTGAIQGTVDRLDDIASLSNLYPAAGWPANRGTITGTIQLTDGRTQISGINVIARNVANPYGDSISAVSGDYSAAQSTAPDGSFTFNGLTPGAQYVVYVDGIVAGGFSTPASPLPGKEEFWNGVGETGQTDTDDSCAVQPITVQAGAPQTASILFNSTDADGNFTGIPVSNTQSADLSANGKIVTGGFAGPKFPGWRWSESAGFEVIPSAGPVQMDSTGEILVANFENANGIVQTGFWLGGNNWLALDGGIPLGAGCSGTQTSLYDVSDLGNTIVGLAYRDGCGYNEVKGSVFGYHWTPDAGYQALLGAGNWTRANAVSANGSVVVGWNDGDNVHPGRQGVYWKNGEQHFISPNPSTEYWGEAMDVSADGSVMVGMYGGGGDNSQAWRYTEQAGGETLGVIDVPGLPSSFVKSGATLVSSDGVVVLGFSGFARFREPFIWTRQLGMRNLGAFLIDQGMDVVADWMLYTPMAFNANSKVLTGWGGGPLGTQAWVVTLNQVAVCTKPTSSKPKTLMVGFPHAMNDQLAQGAIPGRCDRVLD